MYVADGLQSVNAADIVEYTGDKSHLHRVPADDIELVSDTDTATETGHLHTVCRSHQSAL